MKALTGAWLAFIGAATYRWEQSNQGSLPPPSIYLGAGVIYSLLGLLAEPAPELSATFGWALVVAALTTGALLPKTSAAVNPQGGVGSVPYGPPATQKG